MTDAREVAGKLTKAQREALRKLCEAVAEWEREELESIYVIEAAADVRRTLMEQDHD